ASMAFFSHSRDLAASISYCFLRRFSSAIATATCFFASTSWVFMSTSTWLSIFSGSSALLISSLMFERISVPSLENKPMLCAPLGADGHDVAAALVQPGCDLVVVIVEGHAHVLEDGLEL